MKPLRVVSLFILLLIPSLLSAQLRLRTVSALESARCTSGEWQSKIFLVTDGSTAVDCTLGGGNLRVSCICDGGTFRAVNAPSATTTAPGLVELATSGENAANVVVQGNDYRVNSSPSRTIRVDVGATAVTGKVYNTIKAAMDYVATQSLAFETPWDVVVTNGGTYSESSFTIPQYTNLTCNGAADTYPYGLATRISGSNTSGTFITLLGSIRNCFIQVTGNPTAARIAVECTTTSPGAACTLDHVGIASQNFGSTNFSDIGYAASGAGGLSHLNDVLISPVVNNQNLYVGLKTSSSANVIWINGLIDSNSSSGLGKGVQHSSTGFLMLQGVVVGSAYGGASAFATDLADEGGIFACLACNFETATGNVTSKDGMYFGPRATPPATCTSVTASWEYYDTNINKKCICNGTDYVLSNDDTTTTGCS